MAYSNRGDWYRNRNEPRGGDREQRFRQDDWNPEEEDERRMRESMARDQYGNEGRGGYGGIGSGRASSEAESARYGRDFGYRRDDERGRNYNQRGYGQGDYDQEFGPQRGGSRDGGYGRGQEYSGSERDHYGNESGGWGGRESEQWRNRSAHGEYDRHADYGGYGSSGTGNYAGYGGSGGTATGGGHGRDYDPNRYRGGGQGQGQRSYRSSFGQGDYDYSDFDAAGDHRSGRPSGGRASGSYGGGATSYGSSAGYGDEYGRRSNQASDWGSSHEELSGQHRGRGPRGYRRSDDRIREEVCDCLTDDEWLDASNIEIVVKDAEVYLSGTVSDRDDKRRAEALAERISGVKEVQNSIRVQDQQRGQSGQSASSSGQSAASTTGTSASTGSPGTARDKGKDTNIQH